MRRNFLCCLLLLALASAAQRTEYFTLPMPGATASASTSLYGGVDLLDARFDTTCLGVVQLGAFNKRAQVQARPTLSEQFQSLATALGGSGGKRMLVQLRELRFAELTGGTGEEGWCFFRARAFSEEGGRYAFLGSIDSTIKFTVGEFGDVTRRLKSGASAAIADFLRTQLQRAPGDSILSRAEIDAVDSIEKSRVPLYNATTYPDGLYYTYADLAQLQPSITGIIPRLNKKGRLTAVKINMGEEDQQIKYDFCYAVVHAGHIWLSTEFGYYEMVKTGNHFEFDGRTWVTAASSKVLLGALAGGMLGGLMSSGANVYLCHMRVDHANGTFLPLKLGPLSSPFY